MKLDATEPRYPIRFRHSDGELWDIDWRDIEKAMERDPEGYTMPSPDPKALMLTGDDYVMLWAMGVGTGEMMYACAQSLEGACSPSYS